MKNGLLAVSRHFPGHGVVRHNPELYFCKSFSCSKLKVSHG